MAKTKVIGTREIQKILKENGFWVEQQKDVTNAGPMAL